MNNNSNSYEKTKKTIGIILFIVIVVSIVVTICLLPTNNSKSYTSKNTRSYSQRSVSSKQTTTEQPSVIMINGVIAVPYVGMPESLIKDTSLGAPSSNVRHNRQVKNGQQYTANLYDYYKDGALIFTARCVQGKVIQVWDNRDNPVQPYKKSTSSKSSKSSKKDEYDAKDYQNADDFYYDHYDDFYDYEEAEDYYNEHNHK